MKSYWWVILCLITVLAACSGDGDKDSDTSPDIDGDGVLNANDAFPFDPNETHDSDRDGVGNNADNDDDNDGALDTADAFPLDVNENLDTDSDGIGNNADTDDDNDGALDTVDAFPLDANESMDTDIDGVGNNTDTDDDNDGALDTTDAFPLDANESLDTDGDGTGNNADTDDDNDGVVDVSDAFPLDATETLDFDGDGIGNNADTDDDNDGVLDTNDAFPLDATDSQDTDGDGVGDNADVAPADPTRFVDAYLLNDTGITWGGNYPSAKPNATCTGAAISAQDCSSGRDFTANDDTDGHAGFSFTKIDTNGNQLPADATSWACVLDNITGLMWEVKTNDNGLRDADWTYTWYNNDPKENGGNNGVENGGSCFDNSNCDTEKYVAQVNAIGLCGHNDWRLPRKEALRSIMNFYDGGVDRDWFPFHKTYYWSASPVAGVPNTAWRAYFILGHDRPDVHGTPYSVLLVRNGQ